MNSSRPANALVKPSPDTKRRGKKPKPVPSGAIPMGRKWNISDHIAGLHATYQQIIKENAADYVRAKKKKIVSQRIAQILKAKGIRFVRWNHHSSCWEDAPAISVIKRISTACRQSKCAKHSNHKPPGKLEKAKVVTVAPNDPQSPQQVTATSSTAGITNVTGLSILSRTPARAAKMAATAAITQSGKTARSHPKLATGQLLLSTDHQSATMDGTTDMIQNELRNGLVAEHFSESQGRGVRLVPWDCIVDFVEPNLLPHRSFDAKNSIANSSSQRLPLSACPKVGWNWLEPEHPKSNAIKRYFGDSSPRHPIRSKKARNNPTTGGDEADAHAPVTTTLLPPELQPPKTSILIDYSRQSPGPILTPIVSSFDSDKETPKEKTKGQGNILGAQECVTPDIDIATNLGDTTGSSREIERWWMGLQPDQNPFFNGTDNLFDHSQSLPIEPSSPLGLPSVLHLLSDLENNLEPADLSPSFSIPPCKFESLQEFQSNSNGDDVDLLASVTNLDSEGKLLESQYLW